MVNFYRQTSNYLCNQVFNRPLDAFLVKMVGFLLRKIYSFLMKAPRELLMEKHVVLPPMDIKIVCTHSEWNSVYRTLLEQCESIPVLGLDAEWITRFGRRYPVSLLQLAGKDGLCVLIRLNLLPKPFPSSLKSLLADSSILKIGVGISVDVGNLRIDHDLHIRGYLDLRNVLPFIPTQYSVTSYSLMNLAKAIINVDMFKDKSITLSNWESEELTKEQMHYAALDALVGVTIFLQLMMTKLNQQKQHFLKFHSTSDKDIREAMLTILPGIIDCKTPDQKTRKLMKLPENKSTFTKKDSLRAHSLRAYNLRRNPLYDNCQLLAPDNQILCTCDSRKAKWYLYKGLGELVSENPMVIRLNFEPSGRPLNEEGYYQQEKENICVVCGKPENYLRKNIIPHEYRKYFPSIMKDHVSHDILLMCPTCHQKACASDVTLRQKLAEECDAPLTAGTVNKSLIDVDLAKIRSAAKALMTNSHKIPDHRLKELHEFLKTSLGVDELTVDVLQKSVTMDVKVSNPDYSPHGHQVVEHMKRTKKLLEFQLRWRQHFIDTMNPAYLPAKWAIDHNHKHLAPLLDEEIPKFTKRTSKTKSSKSSKSKSKK
ncbi:exonuclease 3'-5' domain-containing protein 2 [Octopus sinensis]|uniref:Exonuclease 3'-5' domain-containing protein 2 n=1 Tax=Octopus sinensis TaxID=2607531 RepID=A0A6P7TH90_9MOLL|nr:exonuclease 3'-5' domain-containing protein 2 [Octopus sinensis]